jgi:hypothetical protein
MHSVAGFLGQVTQAENFLKFSGVSTDCAKTIDTLGL